VVVKVVNAPPVVEVDVEVIEVGPELVGGGEETVLLPPFDWNEALRLTLGEGRSEPASLELVVWLEELRDSTLQDDMSNERGLEVFIRTRLSNVDTLYGIVDSSGSDFLSSSFIEIRSPESQS